MSFSTCIRTSGFFNQQSICNMCTHSTPKQNVNGLCCLCQITVPMVFLFVCLFCRYANYNVTLANLQNIVVRTTLTTIAINRCLKREERVRENMGLSLLIFLTDNGEDFGTMKACPINFVLSIIKTNGCSHS